MLMLVTVTAAPTAGILLGRVWEIRQALQRTEIDLAQSSMRNDRHATLADRLARPR